MTSLRSNEPIRSRCGGDHETWCEGFWDRLRRNRNKKDLDLLMKWFHISTLSMINRSVKCVCSVYSLVPGILSIWRHNLLHQDETLWLKNCVVSVNSQPIVLPLNPTPLRHWVTQTNNPIGVTHRDSGGSSSCFTFCVAAGLKLCFTVNIMKWTDQLMTDLKFHNWKPFIDTPSSSFYSVVQETESGNAGFRDLTIFFCCFVPERGRTGLWSLSQPTLGKAGSTWTRRDLSGVCY